MVNTQQTSTAVATASSGLYEHIDEEGQERVVSVMCICTFECASG